MHFLRQFFRKLPLLCLLAVAIFSFLAHFNFIARGVFWLDRYFIMTSAERAQLHLLLHVDTSPAPLRAKTPYLRIWRGPTVIEVTQHGEPAAQYFFDRIASNYRVLSTPMPLSPIEHSLIDYAGISLVKGDALPPGATGMLDWHLDILLPWWLLAVAALLPLSLQLRALYRRWASREFSASGCPHCGYDLRASTGRCPECGKTFQSATLQSDRPTIVSAIAALPTLPRSFLRHIRMHALYILILISLVTLIFLQFRRPLHPSVPAIQLSDIAPSYPYSKSIDEAFDVYYNIADLRIPVQRPPEIGFFGIPPAAGREWDLEVPPRLADSLQSIAHDTSSVVSIHSRAMLAHLNADQQRKIAALINQHRGVNP